MEMQAVKPEGSLQQWTLDATPTGQKRQRAPKSMMKTKLELKAEKCEELAKTMIQEAEQLEQRAANIETTAAGDYKSVAVILQEEAEELLSQARIGVLRADALVIERQVFTRKAAALLSEVPKIEKDNANPYDPEKQLAWSDKGLGVCTERRKAIEKIRKAMEEHFEATILDVEALKKHSTALDKIEGGLNMVKDAAGLRTEAVSNREVAEHLEQSAKGFRDQAGQSTAK